MNFEQYENDMEIENNMMECALCDEAYSDLSIEEMIELANKPRGISYSHVDELPF